MRELSLHIMDVIENGIAAGASLITLKISEDHKNNLLQVTIIDNGCGIPEELMDRVMDPFYTTRTTRRVGLGLSLFREASRRCEGEFHIESKVGKGTEVCATFQLDHIDMAPLGDMAGSITCLIMGNPEVDFVYVHKADNRLFEIDTRHIRQELEDLPMNNPKVIRYLTDSIDKFLRELKRA